MTLARTLTTHALAHTTRADSNHSAVQGFLNALPTLPPASVLDVGCGKGTHPRGIPLRDQFPFHVTEMTGLDNSPDGLARNTQLDRAIIGDIAQAELEPDRYDVIVCWDVLEHLPEPHKALDRLLPSLRADGLLLVSTPNLWSLKGLITKLTPHWFHVWAYRRLFGHESAGKPGQGPWPTYLRATPGNLNRWAESRGLAVVDARTYPFRSRFLRPPLVGHLWRGSLAVLRSVTLGHWHPEQSEFLLALRKYSPARTSRA